MGLEEVRQVIRITVRVWEAERIEHQVQLAKGIPLQLVSRTIRRGCTGAAKLVVWHAVSSWKLLTCEGC